MIAIEGIDGAGKTTQAKMLVKWFRKIGVHAYYTSEPTNGIIGKLIKKLLRKKDSDHRIDALLFAADRIEHYYDYIEPRLSKGGVVVADRYVYSSMAYQGALTGDTDWVRTINKWIPMADVAIFVDVSPEVGLARLRRRKLSERTKYERLETLRKVREEYLKLCRDGLMLIVNGERSVREVHEHIRKITTDALVRSGKIESNTIRRS